MAIEPAEDAEPLSWAAKWELWWMRVVAAVFALTTLNEVFNLERSVWASSRELKIMIAVPLLIGLDTVYTIWKARREERIDKGLSAQVLTSTFLIVAFSYFGMSGLLRHFLR